MKMTAATENQSVDVEMKSADSPLDETDVSEKKDTDAAVVHDIRESIRQIEKGISTKEVRFISRVIRSLPSIRKRLNSNILLGIINGFYTHSVEEKNVLLTYLNIEQMEVDGFVPQRMRTLKNSTSPLSMEVDVYIILLIVLFLIDQKKYGRARSCTELLLFKLHLVTRRSLDMLAAKCYFYCMRCYELTGGLEQIRPLFHIKLRSASLRNDVEGQAVLINCLLRNYLHFNLYDQADKLVSKSVFPETANNNEFARYLYYLGRIKAARLEYSLAHTNLVQALRKAPQNAAVGFRQAVQKMVITVELLLGDIPDRQIFRQASYRKALDPYFQLTQAVRLGDLQLFKQVLDKFGEQFQKDHTYTLIIRLHHNVIKTAIRAIATSYSRIPPSIVAKKLGLDSAKDAECIVAKAIRDGVIEAYLDPISGYMQTKESVDIYCTAEPQIAFHQRTSFCLELHNQSVKAMRYPPKSYGKDLESAEERREREQQDLELAKEMAEDDDDGFP